MRRSPIEITRARLEAKIDDLIALLDLIDGDADLEPYLADSRPEHDDREDDDEREPNGDELDYNGDETDCSGHEDEGFGHHGYNGTGVDYAERLISSVPKAAKRAQSFAEAPAIPLVYDFRGIRR